MNERFPFLRVEGTHYEMGYQIGKNLKRLIKRFNELIVGELTLEEAKKRAAAFLPSFKRHCPHLLEEIKGVADGAEISLEEALLPNVRGGIHRIRACTAYVISGEATSENNTLIGQNQDLPRSMQEFGVILNLIPETGPQILMWTFAGLIGYQGLNEYGVAFFANSLPEPPLTAKIPPDKIRPGYMVKRLMLEQNSIDGVLKLLDRMNVYEAAFGQSNYVLRDECKIVDVELYSGGYEVLEDDGRGYIAHSNHYVSKNLKNLNLYVQDILGVPAEFDSIPRLKRLNELLERIKGEITVDALREILSDHYNYPRSICRHTDRDYVTIASIIAEPERRRMHICPGNPCRGRYYTYEMEG